MAMSPIEAYDGLYVGGIWALRRSDKLAELNITHVLSLVGFQPENFKNFKEEPWSHYGQQFQHLMIDIDDVDDTDLLIELPKAMRFIDAALTPKASDSSKGGVFVHCAAGKSRSVSTIIAYLLRSTPERFVKDVKSPRKETAHEAVTNALTWIRRTRPMADPNDGFMDQLHLWWTMGCPDSVEEHPIYQRWLYQREVAEHLSVGQAPSRLRFEDEEATAPQSTTGPSLRCKKCRRMLATSAFVALHEPQGQGPCQHLFIEPLSWMRTELQKGDLNGRLTCPNGKCGAAVGRYDWKGFKCSCGAWLTPAFSLQKARVDEEAGAPATARSLGIRMPPGGPRGGNL